MTPIICAGLALAALTSLTTAPICMDDAPYSAGFTIENHHRLVTVRDGDDKGNRTPLFSQKLDTPNLTVVETTLGEKSTRISLLDGKGKVIWTKTLSYAVPPIRVAQQDKLSPAMQKALSKTYMEYLFRYHIAFKFSHPVRIQSVISPEDKMLSENVNFTDGEERHTLYMSRLNNTISTHIDLEPPVIIEVPAPSSRAH